MPQQAPLLIGLVRVSTEKQAISGLGLDAQLAALDRYRAAVGGALIETYHEVESGKHNDIRSRPRLMAAAAHAVEVDAVLVIAKLDRLVRSASVLQYLRDMKVKFVACDNPHANKLTVHILVGVAENEAEQISDRTRQALKAYREGGRVSKRIRALYPDGIPPAIAEATAGKLGASLPACRNLTDAGRAAGRSRSAEARGAAARRKAAEVGRLVTAWRDAEPAIGLEELARRLNAEHRRTTRGRPWSGRTLARALARLESA